MVWSNGKQMADRQKIVVEGEVLNEKLVLNLVSPVLRLYY